MPMPLESPYSAAGSRPALPRSASIALLVAGFGLGAAPVFLGLLNHDAAWLLHAAGRVLDGDRLYVDVDETNPPLIVWLHFVPVLLAKAAGVSEVLAFRLLVLLAVAGSLGLSGWTLRRSLPGRPGGRLLILLAALAALLPMSGYEFGQREHLLLTMTLPYLLMAAARGAGVSIGGAPAWTAGLMAGLVIALKPHFALLWLGVEGYLAAGACGWRAWIRPENLAVIAVGLVYAIAAPILAPEYLALVRWAWPIYTACGAVGLVAMLDHPAVMLSIIAVLCYSMARPRGPCREIARLLLIADLAFLGSVFLQHKGYSYHYYPALAASTMLLAVLFVDSRDPIAGRPRWAGVLGGGLAAAMMIVAVGDRVADSRVWGAEPIRSDTPYGRLARLVKVQAAGGNLYVFSPAVIDAFPMVNEAGVGWTSPHSCLWFLAGLYHGPDRSTPPESYRSMAAMGATERFLFETVVVDLLRNRPDLILVDECARPGVFCVQPFDYLAYFGRDPRFAAFLRDYEPMPREGIFRPYRRRAGIPADALTIRGPARGH